MRSQTRRSLVVFSLLFAAVTILASPLRAQYLTLEGQTGGFLTPTAYVVLSENGHIFSHPAIGAHYVDASKVIGNIQTFSIAEGFANRAEVGYTRSVHQFGDSGSGTTLDLSQLWNYSGMNIISGKVVAIKDGQFAQWVPGIAVGGLVRMNDRFVSGAAGQLLVEGTDQFCIETTACAPVPVPAAKSYTNGDLYVVATKTWIKPPVPFLVNLGLKMTNATIYGIGGQSTRFGGRLFGGLGIPIPLSHGIFAVPSAGFTQEPKTSVNLNNLLNAARNELVSVEPAAEAFYPLMSAHLPTTLDYAVRVTQKGNPHFAFDIGVGQVAGNIGSIYVPTGVSASPLTTLPVNLEARHVVGIGLSYRY